MREIKFRAWVEHESSSEELNSIYPYMQENPEFHGSINEIFKENSIEPENPYAYKITYMQYTGLKDKNGRDIYEGDIVTFGSWDEDIEEEWRHTPALVEYKQNEAAFYLTRSCNIPLAHQKDIEVIGNIYEDPGLLVKSNVS
ncbi:YopX family protein [Heyndrickxia faecalis]|uniref:YopX family protein n=1 Tax=Heyndrickxia faecalis TaxID=2824910 RepID=UPI0032B2F842